MLEAVTAGLRERHVRGTKRNAQSSRSHCVFSLQIRMVQTSAGGGGGRRVAGADVDVCTVRCGTLHLVDLTGR